MESNTFEKIEDVVKKVYKVAQDQLTKDTNTSTWSSPFGGFHIGDPIVDPAEAIKELFASELENEETKKQIEQLIRLECGDNADVTPLSALPTSTPIEKRILAYESTEVGGCEVLNPLYQFNIDDDIVPPINQVDEEGNGMGRVYSEMYRENQHVLWMTFGVPKYKNLSRFYRQAYNKKLTDVLASNDVTMSKKIGTIIGTVGGLCISLPLLPFIGAAKIYDELTANAWGDNMYKYYELRPAMHNYYKIVNTILAALGVHMKLFYNQPTDPTTRSLWAKDIMTSGGDMGSVDTNGSLATESSVYTEQFAAQQRSALATTDYPDGLPDVLGSKKDDAEIGLFDSFGLHGQENGKAIGGKPIVLEAGPDILRILSLRHARRTRNFKALFNSPSLVHVLDSGTAYTEFEFADSADAIEQKIASADSRLSSTQTDSDTNYDPTTGEFILPADEVLASDTEEGAVARAQIEATDAAAATSEPETIWQMVFDAVGEAAEASADAAKVAGKVAGETLQKAQDKINKINKQIKESEEYSTLIDAAMGLNSFIGFRIEGGMDVTESMSNSTSESDVVQQLKSIASSARNRSFNFADGNLGLGPIDMIIQTVNSMAGAVSAAVGLGGLADMVTRGSGYIDIPKIWSDSSFSRSYSFDIKLESPYKDELSVYQSLYIPMAMLMAAGFPKGIGKNAYSSPFLVQAFSKGMFSIPLGIISNISFKRGDSENGWTHGNLPTVITASITLEDLSPMLYLSMTDKNLLEIFRANTNMQDYLATLAGISLQERSNARKMIQRKARIAKLIWAKNTFNFNNLMFKLGAGRAVSRYNRLFGRTRTGT